MAATGIELMNRVTDFLIVLNVSPLKHDADSPPPPSNPSCPLDLSHSAVTSPSLSVH